MPNTCIQHYVHIPISSPIPRRPFPVGVPYNMYPPICRTYAHIAFLYIYTNRLYMSYPAAVSGHIDVDIMSHRYRIPNYYLCYLNP